MAGLKCSALRFKVTVWFLIKPGFINHNIISAVKNRPEMILISLKLTLILSYVKFTINLEQAWYTFSRWEDETQF